MEKLRIGFVGLGGICRTRHVPGLLRTGRTEFVCVSNRSRASGEASAREFSIPHVADRWEDVVAREDIDAVVIGTWPYLHKPVSEAALAAGKHVFCQARMAMDFTEARSMLAAARRAGRVAALCPVPFGLSIDGTVARLLRENALGEVRLVRVQGFYDTFAEPETPISWRKDHRLSGLNALTLGMYVEVVHRWFGWTRHVSAATQIFTATRPDAQGRPFEVRIPDQFLVNTATAAGLAVQYAITGAVRGGRDSIEIYGSKKSLLYDVSDDALYWLESGRAGGRVEQRPDELYDVAQWRVEEDFVAAVYEGRAYHPDFLDGLHYMRVIEGIYASAAKKCAVDLDARYAL